MKELYKKFISYYRNLSAPLKASFWFVICGIIVRSFAVISTPIFTRLLSVEQYGQTANFNSWYDLLYPFVTMYISGVAYNNVLIKHEDDRERATFSLMTLACLLALIGFVIYLFASSFVTEFLGISPGMMCMMFLELMFVPIFDFWSAKERFDYKYKKLILLTILSTVLCLGIGVIGVMLTEYKYEVKVGSKILVSAVIGVILYLTSFKSAGYELTTKYWKYALVISLPLIPHYLSIKILHHMDRVMITNMVGLTQTGMYSLAASVAGLMVFVTDSINRSMCPYVYKSIKSGNISSVKTMTSMVLLLVLAISFLEMLVAPELVLIFATKEYLEAIYIIPPIALSVYFIFLYVVFANVEFYFEKTTFATIVSVIAALVNVITNYCFIKMFGYYAAGFTTLLCYVFFAVMHYWNYTRVLKEHNELKGIFNIHQIIAISFAGILAMFICLFLYQETILRYVLVGILLITIMLKHNKLSKYIKKDI